MPTPFFGHPAPIVALGAALGFTRFPVRLFWVAVGCTMLPDLDVIGFWNGVAYGSQFGHRGFSHSLLFALLCGGLAWLAAPLLRCRRWLALVIVFAAGASHILLDAMTDGGKGVAALWPFSEERFFLPDALRRIRVAPMKASALVTAHFPFLSARGIAVFRSELLWIWLPCLTLALAVRLWLAGRR